ncbi:hypothetical protein DFJ43DRAFT_1078478 [Lentinula guzmanii]|uniref:Uncharacterized protein n=1 Tax=Lentinula guzmanii TaxID=2804957 RepID=A0AA38JJ42_9AGAR|nr:hypothetical protein DFJ43DRAFT_1078478 [Lentinula guzmanii]
MLVFWLAALSLLQSSLAVYQQPFASSLSPEIQNNDDEWDLKRPLTFNSTANLVFATVSSLLQSDPNARYRNGHTIVPGIVRSGTLLYHGRNDSNIPTMEWVAFDPEASHIFCRLYGQSRSCWLHTFRVERPLRILYFDGSSAAKIDDGAIDSQDIFSWGEVRPDLFREEGLRILKLCEWGSKVGLDGFVRTASISEMILCDFSLLHVVSSQRLKSTPLIHVPRAASSTQNLQTPLGTFPISADSMNYLRVHERFRQYPGLTQVQLDLTHLVSFYDNMLAPSLFTVRKGNPRLQHRLLGITHEDIARVRSFTEEQIANVAWLSLEHPVTRRIDWSAHFHSIINSYGDTFDNCWGIINSTLSQSADERALNAFRIVESNIQRFVLYSVTPTHSGGNQSDLAWASSVFRECALSHTLPFTARPLTSSEKLLLSAVEGTTRELCRILTKMWAYGVHEGMSSFFDVGHASKPKNATAFLDSWKEDLGTLMSWLDWGTWMRCKPACNELEFCYLPVWPFSVGNSSYREWRADDPQPRCFRKIAPFIYADDFRKDY